MQRYHTVAGILNLYKANVFSHAECRTAAIYLSCVSSLKVVDKIQREFLNEFGVDEFTAFMSFNLAPLSLRRDIAMLGLIHRTVLGEGPVHFQRFFYVTSSTTRRSERHRRHNRQLYEYRHGKYLDIVGRSALGAASVYNLLPQEIVDAENVKLFQRSLQDLARHAAATNTPSGSTCIRQGTGCTLIR